MRLIELLAGEKDEVTYRVEAENIDIVGLTADSRAVRPGYLFAALPGSRADGRRFIPSALESGAVAVLAPEGTEQVDGRAAMLTSADPRRTLARLAAAFYGLQPETMVAVTGTNGKTSVASFTRQIWEMLGYKAASLGTLGLRLPDGTTRPTLTTPDPVVLHADLADLARQGVDHAAMEASSHGLDQRRLDGVRLRAAGFTNLTHDHLDYHGTLANYFAAKKRLFDTLLPDDGIAVLNADVPEYGDLAAETRGSVLSYGRDGRDLRIAAISPTAHGLALDLDCRGTVRSLVLPLVGGFQAWNVLCAAGLVLACGADADDVLDALPRLAGVHGRMERAGVLPSGAAVYIDYAHTPDALETVLRAVRPHASGRVIALIGCGGDRDRAKRPMMGDIATRLADVVIVTDDNPRSEDPAAIRAEIMEAAPGAAEIGDRAEAIRHGAALLAEGDILVVAGKGHETGQIVGDEVLPFDDIEVAREAIRALGGSAE